ncbi:uncharacterized protein DSM5745_10093 [Aspergillus mulundensis]|uniref:Uncharacterized protein n=1 Tax=Aspergillus mulundensis TaxID=1810919 RepID=A0A3D8QMF7_9EURO|nr:Uncharacterized protein DSM5745_10093 [Aspergillus mulundensis]RDW62982.1 Uncharacterized protein DSM5745_10093 [Aspergillus mulundensis]
MTSTLSAEHPQQSLSESWATLSASDVHSEDGAPSEQTDAGSLIDPSGPDDVASLDGRYSSSDDIDGNSEDSPDNEDYDSDAKSDTAESQGLRLMFPQIGCSIEDSNLTTQTAFHQSTESIEFVEPDKWPEVERVQLKHTIRLIEGPEVAELEDNFSTHLQDSTLMATVQQTITKKTINTDRPFRVLYVGSPEFRGIILDKLGDVLVSSTSGDYESSSAESSRYHVVPTSFGAGAVPNFAELLPIHYQLIVDECLEATSESHIDRPRTINLKFKNRPGCMSHWTGTEYGILSSTDWALPDMAMIFLSSLDDLAAMETQKLARMFMERHGVPAMVVSEKPLWKMPRESIPVNHHSLHMCLESRHSSTGKTTVLKRYPIDLNTFESIAPGQLNKNLASLTSIYPRKYLSSTAEAPGNVQKVSQFDFKNFTRKMLPLPYLSNDTELAFVLRLVILTVLSTATLALGHLAAKAFAVLISSFVTRSVTSNQTSPVPSVYTTSVHPTAELKPSSLPVLSPITREVQVSGHQPNGLSQLQHLMGGTHIDSVRSSEDDEIQVVGDCHLVIKPPSRPSGTRKAPKFNVHVNRRDQPLQYELSRLFEGVYSLKLDRGEAYGLVNVTIITESRPPVTQVVSIDLGTPWLKIANWKRAAHAITSELVRDVGTAQTGLSEVYGRISTELQVLAGDVVKRTHLLREKASVLRRDSLSVVINTDAVLSTSKQLSEVFQRTAVQPFFSASQVLQCHTRKASIEARQMVSSTWGKICAGAQHLTPGAMREHYHNARKSKTLDKAHKRARRLMKGTS